MLSSILMHILNFGYRCPYTVLSKRTWWGCRFTRGQPTATQVVLVIILTAAIKEIRPDRQHMHPVLHVPGALNTVIGPISRCLGNGHP